MKVENKKEPEISLYVDVNSEAADEVRLSTLHPRLRLTCEPEII